MEQLKEKIDSYVHLGNVYEGYTEEVNFIRCLNLFNYVYLSRKVSL